MDCNLYAARYLQFNWTCVLDTHIKSALTADGFKWVAIWSEYKLKYSQKGLRCSHWTCRLDPLNGNSGGFSILTLTCSKWMDTRFWDPITTFNNFWRRKKIAIENYVKCGFPVKGEPVKKNNTVNSGVIQACWALGNSLCLLCFRSWYLQKVATVLINFILFWYAGKKPLTIPRVIWRDRKSDAYW